MKKLLFILLVNLLLSGCSTDKCKIVTEYELVDKFGGNYEQLFSFSIYKYDKSGNKIEDYCYWPSGIFRNKTVYKYDENGNKIEENYYDSDGSLFSKTIFKFDKNGNQIEGNRYNDDGSLSTKEINKCDENGNKIEEKWYSPDGSFRNKTVYKYDENGNKIEFSYYKTNGDLLQKITYKYDENSNEIEKNIINTSFSRGGLSKMTVISKYEYCNCNDIVDKVSQDPSSNSNPTNNTSNNINTTKSSSSNSYQPKQTETKKSKCYKCNGSGDCRGCTKPQKVRTWSNGWRNNTEVRLGRVVCSTCQGNGRVKESVSGGQYNSGNSCHIGDCISGFRTCRDCSKSNPGKCTKCEGSGYDD